MGSHVVLGQAVHGYSHGHTLLATSAALDPSDARMMLVLTDGSAPSSELPDEGYVTGYPLKRSGVFALAKTWPAREMPRPGCVWTHTLFVNFADLATLGDLVSLATLFERPSLERVDEFRTDKHLATHGQSLAETRFEPHVAKELLIALYQLPEAKVMVPAFEGSESLILALWGQQWPRLRRRFRFCSLTGVDRSSEMVGDFDLQCVSGRLLQRTSTNRSEGAAENQASIWLDHALRDLTSPADTDFRSFARRVGSDINTGRPAFAALCAAHAFLSADGRRPELAASAISELSTRLDENEGSRLRACLVGGAAATEDVDIATAEYVVRRLDLLEESVFDDCRRPFGRTLWNRHRDAVAPLLPTSGRRSLVARDAIAQASAGDLLIWLESHATSTRVVLEVLRAHPELASDAGFWRLDAARDGAVVEAAADAHDHIEVLRAMVGSGARIERLATSAFGSEPVLRVLIAFEWSDGPNPATVPPLRNWLAAVSPSRPTVVSLLRRQSLKLFDLELLARASRPDLKIGSRKPDPWYGAVVNAKRVGRQGFPPYLAFFLLARALSGSSLSPEGLLAFVLDEALRALSQGSSDASGWSLVEPMLPRPLFWSGWSSERTRLLRAVVEMFVESKLSPDAFLALSSDDHVFETLAGLASRSRRGRKMLKRAAGAKDRSRSGMPDATRARRIRLIRELLD